MARPLNPELVNLTPQEKRKHYARLYRENSRDVYRKYQREYHRILRTDPDYHEKVVDRRIKELEILLARVREASTVLIQSYSIELEELAEKKKAFNVKS